jgi:hypothetical protein
MSQKKAANREANLGGRRLNLWAERGSKLPHFATRQKIQCGDRMLLVNEEGCAVAKPKLGVKKECV